jgi:alkylation response protein AidB-like acyl-CoA dehydrogenase
MKLILDEEDRLLVESAERFVQKNSPISRFRKCRYSSVSNPLSDDVWQNMANLGWLGVHIPEQYGGLGLDFTQLSLILAQVGRTLMPDPLLAHIATSCAILQGGTEKQKCQYLEEMASGGRRGALAHTESRARYDLSHVECRAEEIGGTWTIDGTKSLVLGAKSADILVVSARTAGDTRDRDGISLFLVESNAPGIRITSQNLIDGRPAAVVDMKAVTAIDVLGPIGGAYSLLEAAVDRTRIAHAAESLGTAQQAFDISLAYLKERHQFGVPIGSFQALKHRASRMFVELELTRSAILAAAATVKDDPARIPAMASLAVARAGDTLLYIASEGIQMHGGVGVTDEYDIGLFFKRAQTARTLFGDPAFHRERWATLHGY